MNAGDMSWALSISIQTDTVCNGRTEWVGGQACGGRGSPGALPGARDASGEAMHAEFVGDELHASPCATRPVAKKRSYSDDCRASPARLSGRSTPLLEFTSTQRSPASSALDEARESALVAERQAQVMLLNPFQRLTVDIPHDRKRLRLSDPSDDPLEVESLGESTPPNRDPDSADEPSSFAADFDMEPTRPAQSPTDHERLSPISRVLLTGRTGKAAGLWTLQRRSSFAMRSSLTPEAALPGVGQSPLASRAPRASRALSPDGVSTPARTSPLPSSGRVLQLDSVELGRR